MTTFSSVQAVALLELRAAADAREEAEAAFLAASKHARVTIRAACDLGVPIAAVARAARVNRQRVWQIRQRGELES